MAAQFSPSKPLTIALIVEGLEDQYESFLFKGVRSALEKAGAGFVCFSGGCLRPSPDERFDPQTELIHTLTPPGYLDGCIVVMMMGNTIPHERFLRFINHFRGKPLVSIGHIDDTIPCVEIDNKKGMASVVEHLIIRHEARRIAFLKGNENNRDALDRFEAYREVLQRHGIPYDETIVFPGEFGGDWGVLAVKQVVERKIPMPDAFVGISESTIIGAINELRAQGFRVPKDVACAGFDGFPESRYNIPSITTAVQPFFEQGAQAARLVLNLIAGQSVSGRFMVKPLLAIRESCGCVDAHGLDETVSINRASGKKLLNADERNSAINNAVLAIAPGFDYLDRDSIRARLHDLVTELERECLAQEQAAFGEAFDAALTAAINQQQDPVFWREPLAELRRTLRAANLEPDLWERMDECLKRALARITDLAHRHLEKKDASSYSTYSQYNDMGGDLANTSTREEFAAVLSRFIPRFDLDECHILLYDPDDSEIPYHTAGYFLFSYRRSNVPLPKGLKTGQRYTCNEFLSAVSKQAGKQTLILEQLKIGSDILGLALFTSNAPATSMFTGLRTVLSNGIRSLNLTAKVQKQADDLSEANRNLTRLRAQEQEYLNAVRRELDLARKIQADFLPQSLPSLAGWDMAVHFQPAQEVAGDFYDVFMLPGSKAGIVVADVCGKSVSAAIFMALVRSLIRALSEKSNPDDLLTVISFVNGYIMKNHHHSSPYMYVTLFYGILDIASGRLDYINAGHLPPLITDATHAHKFLDPTGPAVGLTGDIGYRVGSTTLASGDCFFAYTDGITEAKDAKGVLLGKESMFTTLDQSLVTPQSIIDSIKLKVAEHCKGAAVTDDITMMALKRI